MDKTFCKDDSIVLKGVIKPTSEFIPTRPDYYRSYFMCKLYSECLEKPADDVQLQDRVVLVASDLKKFYPHASVVCMASPVLHGFRYGELSRSGVSEDGTIMAPRCQEFLFKDDIDGDVLSNVLYFIHTGEFPESHFAQTVTACDFLQVAGFKNSVKVMVQRFIEQKKLTSEEWEEVACSLVQHGCGDSFHLLVQAYAKPAPNEVIE